MNYLFDTLLEANEADWKRYIEHAFVRKIGDGSLHRDCFEHYLKQDYVFLIHFARAFGLAAFKSTTRAELEHAKASMSGIVDIELNLHVQYCESWGISCAELEATVESTANMAYTRYVMERGLAGNLLDLNVALAPCIIGYAHIAKWLSAQSFLKTEDNPYSSWIEMYSSDEYQDLANAHRDILNQVELTGLSRQRILDLSSTFGAATRLEIDFWQMGLDLL
ncbi:MAG: thiaminase II [Granulosicoccus sp.]